MAVIPGVPIVDPVNKPMMSPAEAGKPGQAISQLGAESNDVALQGLDFDIFLKKAQQNVDEQAFQNEAHASVLQYQDALAKTTNSRDVADVTLQAKTNMNQLVARWQKSPALVQIQLQADSLTPQLDHLGVVKTADLQVKESAVQTNMQMQTLLPQMVTAQRNGDKGQTEYINGYINHVYEQREAAGLISHAEAEKELNAIQIQFRSQLNESYISSADPKERQAAIQQLKTGGSGPLNLMDLAPGDVAALRTQAESTNERLNNLAEAGNLNRDLNIVQNAFAAPEYAHNYEARVNSLQDGDWLVKHGIVAEDGSPNRVMAEKLIAETNRQRGEWEKEQADRDNKSLEKIEPLIIGNKISRGQLVQASQEAGLSPRAYNAALAKWDENQRYNHQVAVEGRQSADYQRKEKSQEAAADWTMKIAAGAIPSDADIRMTPNLTKADQSYLVQMRDKARADKPYQGGMTVIAAAYAANSKMTPEKQAQQHELYLRTMEAYDQEINAHPGEDKEVIAGRLVMPGVVRDAIQRSVPGLVPTQEGFSAWDRIKLGVSGIVDRFEGADAKKPVTATPPANPTKGDKFNGFTWDGNGWTK